MKKKFLYPKLLFAILLFSLWLNSSNFCLGQIPSYIPTSGLKAWYPFTGNANDSSGFGANGTAYGTVAYGTDRFGNAHSCYLGNGAGGFNIPSTNLPVGNHSRSVSVWFKEALPFPGGPRMLISWGNNSSAGQRFGIFADDSLVGFESVGAHTAAAFTHDSVWHNLIVTYSSGGSSGISVYIDGVHQPPHIYYSLSSLSTDTGTIHAIGTLFLSIYYSWKGSIDDISVWDRTLTACEIWQVSHSLDSANAGTISGVGSVCPGDTATLSASASGGFWVSNHTSIATIDSFTGLVTGATAGLDTIKYIVSTPCGTVFSTHVITVDSAPNAGVIAIVQSSICPGDTIVLSDPVTGGAWSSKNVSIATITGTGAAIGVSGGTDTILYIVTNTCGSDTSKTTITVLPHSVCAAGIEEIPAGDNMIIYPSPNQGIFSVHLPFENGSDAKIIVANIYGEKVKEILTNKQETEIQMHVSPGVYFLSVILENKRFTGKIVVE